MIAMGVTTPVAAADPIGSGQVATAPTLGLRELGSNPALTFYGLQSTQKMTIPVPPGLTPATLNASVELPFTLRRELPFDPPIGSIAVVQGDRTISRVDLPGADNEPIRIPLTGAEVRDNAITVSIRADLVPPEGYCSSDPSNPLRLNNSSVEFAGTERAPATVADFLPPVLQRLTIFVPAKPTRTESDTAVQLTAAIVAHYGDQPTAVTVSPLDGDAPLPQAQPFERQLVVHESATPTVRLQGSTGVPSLLVAGPASELLNQTRLLTRGDIAQLALSSTAAVGPLADVPHPSVDTTTLRDLGQPGRTAKAVANPQVSIKLDQTGLGHPARQLRVHLTGFYTPLPSNLGGQVVVSVNGEPIDRWPADAKGAIDHWVDVPDRLLQRSTELGVAIDAAGNTEGCGESQPIMLTIDGDSTVSSTAATPPIPAGFQSLPQALAPRVEIGIGDDAFADTARAAKIIAGLQRLSARPIDTSVVSLADAIGSSNPAILIAAQKWDDARLKLPVNASDDAAELETQDAAGEPVSLTLDPGLRFGSLQTVYTGDRTVLVATSNGSPAQLDGLLDWLNADPLRWNRLDGSAVVAPADREPVVVAAKAVSAAQPSPSRDDSTHYWLLGAGLIAMVLLGSGVIYLRTRTRT
jgi:hypothetical protein